MRKPKKFKKMYVDEFCKQWFWSRWTAATHAITFALLMDKLFVDKSRRGIPWKCLLSRGVRLAAERDPTLFPHPVKFVYTEGNKVYILARVSPKRARQLPLAICYRHNFTKALRQFDKITKTQFLEMFGERDLEIRLRPPRVQRRKERRDGGRPQVARRPTGFDAGEKRLVGAQLRAKEAGILNVVTLGGEEPGLAV